MTPDELARRWREIAPSKHSLVPGRAAWMFENHPPSFARDRQMLALALTRLIAKVRLVLGCAFRDVRVSQQESDTDTH